eukprot:364557-Chlamydomonas_euryale.AAC.45
MHVCFCSLPAASSVSCWASVQHALCVPPDDTGTPPTPVSSVDEAVESCRKIGYPVMLKASWGGGGKGIRKVHSDDEVVAVFKQVQGEVPGSPIFAMKLAPIRCVHVPLFWGGY